MSHVLLERVEAAITAAGLNTGYQFEYFRWSDERIGGSDPFILLRRSGEGDSNVLLQKPDVDVLLVGLPTTIKDSGERAQAILRLFRQPTSQAGIVRFLPMGGLIGPLSLENGRPVWQLTVRCVTEDQ